MRRVLCVWLPEWSQQRQRVAQAWDRDSWESHREKPSFLNFASGPRQENSSESRETSDRFSRTTPQTLTSSATNDPPPDIALVDRKALEALAAWCDQFSPTVGLEESDSPESLLLDITGLAPLFHGEEALAELVVQQFERRGY